MSKTTTTIALGKRFAAPAEHPHPLAMHDGTLWVGCWGSERLYAIDRGTGAVVEEVAAPGKPFGLTSYRGTLRAVISLGEEDDRYFFNVLPGTGFDASSKTACPEFTGSHLAADGETLYVAQMTNQRVLALDGSGAVRREIPLPTRCAGIGFGNDGSYMISTDEEFEELTFATFPLLAEHPAVGLLAAVPAAARSLAFDGASWWTCLREENAIVSFTLG